MVKWFSNLPDSDHVPYTFIAAEPHLKTVVRYFRTEDYAAMVGIGAGFPLFQVAWERMSPSIHPRYIPRSMLVQVPFFATCGFIFAIQRSYFRFWGWRENGKEVARWESEAHLRPSADEKQGWEDNDWVCKYLFY
ncbi:NADH-ubiquinone oxidoreductase complex I, 21 kDa subunit-domain-containing protein [Chytridium lagenaria]|nr:NADH-ubiquinone oxidoreductase complex I, 21 kDa subunit-domain-containing protein [Chytridium lagenaria]